MCLPTTSYMKGKTLRTCRETRSVFENLASGQGCENTAQSLEARVTQAVLERNKILKRFL